MQMGKALGLTLVGAITGVGLLAAAPATAFADEDAAVQQRLQELEKQVQDLREQLNRKEAGEASLADQIDRYLQEDEKGALWVDRNGNPLSKAVDSVWVQGSLRFRPEYRENYTDFSYRADDSGLQTFTRTRLGVGANLHGGVSAFMELNMPGAWGNATTTFANDGGFTITPALYQAWVKGLWEETLGWSTQLGRFEMVYGDEYVIGDRDFSQGGLAFDGVRVSKDLTAMNMNIDVFFANLVEGFKNPAFPGVRGPDDDVYLFGVYGNWYGYEQKTGWKGSVEPYAIVVKNNNDVTGIGGGGTVRDIITTGARWTGDRSTAEKGGLGWNVNANGQMNGDLFWSHDARLMYNMTTTKWKPTVWAQYAYAGGDKDPTDPSYNPLFQDVHGRYGWADAFVFSNLAVYGLGAAIHPQDGLSYGLEGRAIYQARSTTALGSRRVAWEFDFVVKHEYSENVSVEAAYSYINWRGDLEHVFDDVHRAYVNLVVAF